MTDFSAMTACGECCAACPKRLDGRCPGCMEADGHVPEWAESGRCKVHACARDHHVQFCGLCAEFPCSELPSLISWNPADEIIHIFSEHASWADRDEMRGGMYLREYTALSRLCGGLSSGKQVILLNGPSSSGKSCGKSRTDGVSLRKNR